MQLFSNIILLSGGRREVLTAGAADQGAGGHHTGAPQVRLGDHHTGAPQVRLGDHHTGAPQVRHVGYKD